MVISYESLKYITMKFTERYQTVNSEAGLSIFFNCTTTSLFTGGSIICRENMATGI
jgi:hypothetical protein